MTRKVTLVALALIAVSVGSAFGVMWAAQLGHDAVILAYVAVGAGLLGSALLVFAGVGIADRLVSMLLRFLKRH